MSDFKPGLEGVVAFETEIAEPDKEGSALRYRGIDIEELVGVKPYEQVWGLLVDDSCEPCGRACCPSHTFCAGVTDADGICDTLPHEVVEVVK